MVKSSARPRFATLRRLLRWTLWLGLSATLVLQLRILADGGLRVPDFAVAAVARRLAAHGLSFQAADIWLDPRGRVLVVEPRAGLASPAGEDPGDFVSARAVALQLRRRELLRGELAATRIEVAGLDLSLPARQSPTGAAQALLEGGEFRLARAPGESVWNVEQASARVLAIPTAFTGALPSAPASTPRPEPAQAVRSALKRAAGVYRRIADLPLDSIRSLRIDLASDHLDVAARVPSLRVPAHPAIPARLVGTGLEDAGLLLSVPFADPTGAELRLDAARLEAPRELALDVGHVALRLSAPGGAEDLLAELAVSGIRKTDTPIPAAPLVATVRHTPATGLLDASLRTRLADAPWSIDAAGSPLRRSGEVNASGPLTPALLEVVRPFLPEKARPVLQLSDPVRIEVSATLSPGGVPGRIVARASSGRAVAHHVPFDRAGALLTYDPAAKLFRADELLLVQSDSRAEGSYEMDTDTLAYRFLLGGRLRPLAIEGWFSGWWDRFWANFTFGPVPPAAEVDIRGKWRAPDLTTVFVGASSGPMRLRGLPLDTLTTRIQVETDFFDILAFRATRGPFSADGAFSRRLDPETDEWTRMTFDVRADFPAGDLALLFPEEGPSLVAPFKFDSPPIIRLAGEVFGPAAPAGQAGRQRYTLDLTTTSPLRYHDFPLDHLALRLTRQDSELRLENIRAGFATGLAQGTAALSGPEQDRWLAFDLSLADAKLDLVLAHWREFQASRGAPALGPSPETNTPKPLGGALALGLVATGPLDDPLAFSGRGSARIVDAELARIRLFGGFSTLLSELGIGLTTLQLTAAEASFDLDRRRLVFDDLELTGPSATVEAHGAYTLPEGFLDFSAKVRPFDQRTGILSSTVGFVLSPLTHVLEVELDGTLDEPDWTFSYGPTRLFRRITGQSAKSPPPAPAPGAP